MLLDKMLQKPDIARGFVKENRDQVAEFWKQLTVSLNSVGPPVKSEYEWKKVNLPIAIVVYYSKVFVN